MSAIARIYATSVSTMWISTTAVRMYVAQSRLGRIADVLQVPREFWPEARNFHTALVQQKLTTRINFGARDISSVNWRLDYHTYTTRDQTKVVERLWDMRSNYGIRLPFRSLEFICPKHWARYDGTSLNYNSNSRFHFFAQISSLEWSQNNCRQLGMSTSG